MGARRPGRNAAQVHPCRDSGSRVLRVSSTHVGCVFSAGAQSLPCKLCRLPQAPVCDCRHADSTPDVLLAGPAELAPVSCVTRCGAAEGRAYCVTASLELWSHSMSARLCAGCHGRAGLAQQRRGAISVRMQPAGQCRMQVRTCHCLRAAPQCPPRRPVAHQDGRGNPVQHGSNHQLARG